MTLSPNQFAQTPVQGQMDLAGFGSNVITGQVDAAVTSPTTLPAGQAVKMATTSGGVPKFIPIAAVTDHVFGFIAYNPKNATYAAGEYFELALNGSVMYMTATGAIVRGAKIEMNAAGTSVTTTGGTNPTSGLALDTAVNSGDLIRVLIQVPA